MLHNETIRPTPRHRLRLPLRQLPAMDLPFLVLVLTLVGFGLVMLASASSAVALYRRGDAWAYLRTQLPAARPEILRQERPLLRAAFSVISRLCYSAKRMNICAVSTRRNITTG